MSVVAITAPHTLPASWSAQTRHVFMAGGITGCPDWQSETLSKLAVSKKDLSGVVFLNPRRSSFDVNDPLAADEQVEWERQGLLLADVVHFWFPKEGLCPITLYELGWAVGYGVDLRVGVEPGYVREYDVRKQLSLVSKNIKVHSTLDELYREYL